MRWADQFRLQAARVALYQGNNTRVRLLLKQPVSDGTGAAAIERDLYLSLALARSGEIAQAQSRIEDAKRKSGGSEMQAQILFASGNLALELGETSRAVPLFHRTLVLARRGDDSFLSMQVLGNLGVAALRKERFETAQAMFQQAGSIARTLDARLALEKYLGNAAWALYSTGDFERARVLYQQAVEQAVSLGASADLVQWRINLGLCEWKLHRLPEARAAFDRALKSAEETGNEGKSVDAHLSLGMLFSTDEPQLAIQHARAALAIATQRKNATEAMSAQMLVNCLEAEHSGSDADAQQRAMNSLEKMLLAPLLVPSLRWQIEDELGRLAEAQGDQLRADRFFQHAVRTFQRQRRSLVTADYQLPFRETGSDLLNDYLEHLIAGGQVWQALKVLDSSRAHALEAQLAVRPETPRNEGPVQYGPTFARQVRGTALVYRIRPERSYLWVIGCHGRAFFLLPGGIELRSMAARHQSNVLESRDLRGRYGEAGRALFHALIAPAVKLIRQGSDRVLLMVDGDLAQLNFETLLTEGHESHYWIEDVAVTNVRSLHQALRTSLHHPARRGSRLLVISNDKAQGTTLPPLQHAREELREVASHFSPAATVILDNSQATPHAYFTSNPYRYRYLHFIAHGTADDLQPLQSAILLAGDLDHSHLYARDIMAHPLQAELVTLSSCFGSGSKSYAGEGTVGMAWAFQRAGAQHVIAALWQVSDASASQLMNTLYSGLQQGLPPDEALRQAKLALLRQPGILRKPFYWAPLVLY